MAARVGVLLVDRVREHADRAHEQLLVHDGLPADLLDGLLDLLAHLVEGVGQHPDLVAGSARHPGVVVAAGQAPRALRQLLDRAG